MVTSNKLPEKKIVKMAEQNNSAVVPQRTLLGEVNEHITCPLCGGYYIDATTIVECLHSFCRSCIIKHLQVKSYCPECEMMINSAKPNIKLDKALQDIVYKLVPGLFQKEMERRQQFYASRPGPAASATPEQRGEDTERIIFSPEDVISFSLEYADATDADSISSKSSDSNEPQPVTATTRRYLQCPAVVNISHLKKFLSMKFDIDSSQFAIDILYKRVPLPDYYTLMDIAYIYNWKRNEPMRFFYQIIDYIAIRNRIFDINRKGSHFGDRKSSPTSTVDTNASSPTLNLNENESSGTDSPMPEDSSIKQNETSTKQSNDTNIKQNSKNEKVDNAVKDSTSQDCAVTNKRSCASPKKNDEDVEKSQFLNSFELTAKNNSGATKSPVKVDNTTSVNLPVKVKNPPKSDESLKRKHLTLPQAPLEMKKLKIELEKAKITNYLNNQPTGSLSGSNLHTKIAETQGKISEPENISKSSPTTPLPSTISTISNLNAKDTKQQVAHPSSKQPVLENTGAKRTVPASPNISSSKRKIVNENSSSVLPQSSVQKTVSPLKLQVHKLDTQLSSAKSIDTSKQSTKKIPDLKPTTPTSQPSQSNKGHPVNKLRMDLLANNSDPTIDRSKILSQVKTSLSVQNPGQTSGDPLKSLFDSCKINIPSSLSITLTDQKLDPRNPHDTLNSDQKKCMVNKNLTSASNVGGHKVPSPPVHNYIEILKLPDVDPKKNKTEVNTEAKSNLPNKVETAPSQSKPVNKSSETSAKGPIPNLKPIADTKLGKQSGNFSAPITFQQTFEQQLQSLQSDKKSKLPKNKAQVPKLVPATPKAFSAANKLNNSPNNKLLASGLPPTENKPSTALDLSTPHNIESQLGPQQTKVFETMQSIANLAKKQNLSSKGLPLTMSQSNVFPGMSNRPLTTGVSSLRIPQASSINQTKVDKSPTVTQSTIRQDSPNKSGSIKPTNAPSSTVPSPGYAVASHNSPIGTQPSPRSQTRSPSSSPKLVIAEDKQTSNIPSEQNQSNQITSTQLSGMNMPKSESPKASPGPSKTSLKPVKPLHSSSKVSGIRQPITQTIKTNPPINTPADYLPQPPLFTAHQALLRHQMEIQNAWLKAQRQYDLYKNMSNMAHDFNNKDKQ